MSATLSCWPSRWLFRRFGWFLALVATPPPPAIQRAMAVVGPAAVAWRSALYSEIDKAVRLIWPHGLILMLAALVGAGIVATYGCGGRVVSMRPGRDASSQNLALPVAGGVIFAPVAGELIPVCSPVLVVRA